MIEEGMENRRTVAETKSKEHNEAQADCAADFLLRSRYCGIFYQSGDAAYMIPIQYTLGYKVAPLRIN